MVASLLEWLCKSKVSFINFLPLPTKSLRARKVFLTNPFLSIVGNFQSSLNAHLTTEREPTGRLSARQLVEHRTSVREVAGTNSGPINTQGL